MSLQPRLEREQSIKQYTKTAEGYKRQILTVSQAFDAGVRVHQLGEYLSEQLSYRPSIHPEAINAVRAYLQGPTISDVYGNRQSDRRQFLRYIQGQYPAAFQWLNGNRLRQNHMYALGMLGLLLPKNLVTLPVVQALLRTLPKDAATIDAMENSQSQVILTEDIAKLVRQVHQLIQLR